MGKVCKLWAEVIHWDVFINFIVNQSFLGYKNSQNLVQLNNHNFREFLVLNSGRRKILFFTTPFLVHSNNYLLIKYYVLGGGLLKRSLITVFSLFWSTFLIPLFNFIYFHPVSTNIFHLIMYIRKRGIRHKWKGISKI